MQVNVLNICILWARHWSTKYTTLLGRVCNGCSHDFKFAETSSKFHKKLYIVSHCVDINSLMTHLVSETFINFLQDT